MKKQRYWIAVSALLIALNLSTWAWGSDAGDIPAETDVPAAEAEAGALLISEGAETGEAIITIRTTSGETYGFYGDLLTFQSGSAEHPAEVELYGWQVGYDDGQNNGGAIK